MKIKRDQEYESYTTFMTKGLKYHVLGDKFGNIMYKCCKIITH